MCLPGQNKANTSELRSVPVHLLLQSWISHPSDPGLIHDLAADIWKNETEEEEEEKKIHQKMTKKKKAVLNLNLDNHRTKRCKLIYTDRLLK